MEERLINNASFSKICKLLQKKTPVWENVKPILQAVMLIVPILVNKEFAAALALREVLDQGLTWLDSGDKIENAIASVKKLVSNDDEDFITRAENAQIANVLLIFSAYFDTVKMFLPDKNGNVRLDDVQYCLTEKSLKAYKEKLLAREKLSTDIECRRVADWELVLPNPLEGLDAYEKRLKDFYVLLNNSFSSYIEGLAFTEELPEHLRAELNRRLEKIPKAAVGNYRAQYYSLSAICPDFFVWSNQQEHQQQKELVDRGFHSLSEQIRNIPEAINEYQATEALNALQNWYSNRLKEPVIPIKDLPPEDQEMKVPTREESFVPQDYEWLIYRERISLEAAQQWKDGGEIGPDILNILRSPELGTKPILILGDPGAGKTTLCHMLAGKILCGEYNVIVLHLRDLNAEQSIVEQINEEIEHTAEDCDCKWGNIAKAKPKKPILLIFDGYDELLQASGKTYSNYLDKIIAFQEKQWETRGIVVRSIVTSRIVLIDKIEVPLNSVVLRLKAFDKSRIDAWCEVWNNANVAYFESKGLQKFEVEESSKAWELAGEPLLLLMLALFDTKGNALRKHQNLQETELYGSLIRDFVEREKKKNPEFEKKESKVRNREIEKEIERISIAALGMYNRNRLHITTGQLEDDLKLLNSAVNTGRELQDSEQLLGSFFFIHDVSTRSGDVEVKEKLRAYTFLHNTFGEFLTAYYITFQLYNLLDDLNRHIDKYEDAAFSLKDRLGWYACLSYAPLFRRPVVGQMISEWCPQYFQSKGLAIDDATYIIKDFINREIPRLLRGAVICELESVSGQFQVNENECKVDLLEYLAIYTNNILSLAALLTDGVNLDKVEQLIPEAWKKLLYLWRFIFDENEIAAFAGQYELKFQNDIPLFVASDVTVELQRENNRTTKLYKTHKNLHEEPERSILGALLGFDTEDIQTSLREQNLHTEAKNILLGIVLKRAKKEQFGIGITSRESKILKSYPDKCMREGDLGSLYAYLLVLNDIASSSKDAAKYVLSLLDLDLLLGIYSHCSRHYPVNTIPILNLIDKLIPVIQDRDLCWLLDRFSNFYRFESRLSEQGVNVWASILLQCTSCSEVSLWLHACWKLLSHAEKCWPRGSKYYSSKTIERLCQLSFEASRNDPNFPLDLLDNVKCWIDERICHGNLPVSILPVVELLEMHNYKKHGRTEEWPIDKILNACDCESEASDQSIRILANLLLESHKETNHNVWLDAAWQILRSAHQCFLKNECLFSDDTVEKLMRISIEANKRDLNFPLDFLGEYAIRVTYHIQKMRECAEERSSPFSPPLTSDLAVLVTSLSVMSNGDHYWSREGTQLLESTNVLLQIMHRKGERFSVAWHDMPVIVMALCRTIHMYSDDVRAYVLTELVDYVISVGTELPLELYRMLIDVSETYRHTGLQKALAQL